MEETTNQADGRTEEKDGTSAVKTVKSKKSVGEALKGYFTATRIAYTALFTALSFVLRLLQFAVLPAVPYLKLDFSDVFVLICAYALGPVAGIIAGVLKEAIYGIFFTSSAFVGELANILMLLPFVLIPSILYKKHKGIKAVLAGLVISCVVRVLWSFPVNWLLNFPVFVGFNWELGMNTFIEVWYWAMLFNLIKTVIVAAVAMILYKPLSNLIKLTNDKFEKSRKKKA